MKHLPALVLVFLAPHGHAQQPATPVVNTYPCKLVTTTVTTVVAADGSVTRYTMILPSDPRVASVPACADTQAAVSHIATAPAK